MSSSASVSALSRGFLVDHITLQITASPYSPNSLIYRQEFDQKNQTLSVINSQILFVCGTMSVLTLRKQHFVIGKLYTQTYYLEWFDCDIFCERDDGMVNG